MEEENIKLRVMGIDISNEMTTYAIVDLRGNIIAEDNFVTTDYPNINQFVTKLTDCMVELMEANGGFMDVLSMHRIFLGKEPFLLLPWYATVWGLP